MKHKSNLWNMEIWISIFSSQVDNEAKILIKIEAKLIMCTYYKELASKVSGR